MSLGKWDCVCWISLWNIHFLWVIFAITEDRKSFSYFSMKWCHSVLVWFFSPSSCSATWGVYSLVLTDTSHPRTDLETFIRLDKSIWTSIQVEHVHLVCSLPNSQVPLMFLLTVTRNPQRRTLCKVNLKEDREIISSPTNPQCYLLRSMIWYININPDICYLWCRLLHSETLTLSICWEQILKERGCRLSASEEAFSSSGIWTHELRRKTKPENINTKPNANKHTKGYCCR